MADEEATPSDEEMRKLLKPNPSQEQVLELLRKDNSDAVYTVVKELDSYDDKNYLVKKEDGTLYLFKVHNGVESRDFLENGPDSCIHFQNSIMTHLNEQGISTSAPVPFVTTGAVTMSASLPVLSEAHSPETLVVRLLTFVPGRPMSSLPFLPIESLLDAGRFLGKLDSKLNLMDPNQYKASKRYHAWDGKNTLDLRDYTQYIQDELRRGMVESILDTFQHDIIDKGVKFRTGILQADFNDANILANDDLRVSGVIDFGDSIGSWQVLEISVAMAYAMLSAYGKKGRSIGAAAAVLRGYNSVNPLQDVEVRHLYLLMTCRLACSATLGAYSLYQNPENEYLKLHGEPAWRALELLWGYDAKRRVAIKAAVQRVFDKACCQDGDGAAMDCSDLSFPDPQVIDLLSTVRNKDDDDSAPASKRQKTEPNGP